MNNEKIMELETKALDIVAELNNFYKAFEKGNKKEMELGLAYLDTIKCRVNGIIELAKIDYSYASVEDLTI